MASLSADSGSRWACLCSSGLWLLSKSRSSPSGVVLAFVRALWVIEQRRKPLF